ncbi:hypothetical protein BDB01DRAFT_898607 [Pilobolus umbonatus]|nr:hypothetical protein BDB01DRAFT_898607 [Pilobolus umbonatus]
MGINIQLILDAMKKMNEENAALKEMVSEIKEDMMIVKEKMVVLEEKLDSRETKMAPIAYVDSLIRPPVTVGLLKASHWKTFLMDSSIFPNESHMSKVPVFLKKSKIVFNDLCDTHMEMPDYSRKTWGDLTPTQKAVLKRAACSRLLEQCPELAIIQSCQDLWPLSAAIQPRWINSIHYKRLRIAADAEKLELAELRRQAATADPSSSDSQ